MAAPSVSRAIPLNDGSEARREDETEAPVVIAQHLVFTTYGFWLPNDPRGSWSDFVRCWEIYWYGPATRVTTSRSLAHDGHDRSLRAVQKSALRHDPVRLSEKQITCVARGFARAVGESGYDMRACAIMPDHVHTVIRRHRNSGEQVIGHLKARATQQLLAEGLHPFQNRRDASGKLPPAWVRNGWKVFLDTEEDVGRAVRYVEQNPVKQGMARQQWAFVTPV